jgi:hypothetical protein
LEETGLEPVAARTPCPKCGSDARNIRRSANDSVALHSSLRLKHTRGATGKVAQEQQVGDDFRYSDGSWVDLTRVKDYEADRYVEHIEDDSGQVIRHVDEPLSEHRGRGSDSAKQREERAVGKAQKAAERAARKSEIDAAWRARVGVRSLDEDGGGADDGVEP